MSILDEGDSMMKTFPKSDDGNSEEMKHINL